MLEPDTSGLLRQRPQLLKSDGHWTLWRVRGLESALCCGCTRVSTVLSSHGAVHRDGAEGRSVMHRRLSLQLRVRRWAATAPDASMCSRRRARCCLLAQTPRRRRLPQRPSLMRQSRRNRAQVMLQSRRLIVAHDNTYL